LLQIAKYHRSREDARDYVGKIADDLGIKNFKSKLAVGKPISLTTTGKSFDPRNEVQEARLTGVPPTLQSLFDNADRLMPPGFSLGADSDVISISRSVGSYTVTLNGSGLIETPVSALADDLLFYRRNVPLAAEEQSFEALARCYRTYLQVSISMVDAFLGHATFALQEVRSPLVSLENFKTITSPAPFAVRIEAWCNLWGQSPDSFRQSKCWSDLQMLRQERNRYVHPAQPLFAIGIDEIVKVLNACRDGVGGTLDSLRQMAGLDPRLSYIERIKTAPIITRKK
jgi:hypothetical protein